MRNEIWSLISFAGAPSWFITFSPADNMHPISLYFADTDETFSPTLRSYEERYLLIAHNPVAGARFFDFMVKMFIKHVLGVGEKHPGFYGNTEAYYGTVERVQKESHFYPRPTKVGLGCRRRDTNWASSLGSQGALPGMPLLGRTVSNSNARGLTSARAIIVPSRWKRWSIS
jgi:hypothetical protein